MTAAPQVFILTDLCKGLEDCGLCAFVCPRQLFTPSGEMNPAGYLPPRIEDQGRCTGCGNCQIFCPDLAIVVQGLPKKEEAEP